MVADGGSDYHYDEYYVGRTGTQQIQPTSGGFKTPLISSDYGRTNSFLLALNLKSDLPINLPLNLPLKPYFDIGYIESTGLDQRFELMYNLGLALEFGDGLLGVYFPLLSDKCNPPNDLECTRNKLKERGNYFNRIGFTTININQLNPFDIIAKNL